MTAGLQDLTLAMCSAYDRIGSSGVSRACQADALRDSLDVAFAGNKRVTRGGRLAIGIPARISRAPSIPPSRTSRAGMSSGCD
jgi:hypothetical protein